MPGLQAPASARHWPTGSVQIPLAAHEFVQQFESEPQGWPTRLQSMMDVTQVPLHAPLQHSLGREQVAPSGSSWHVATSGPQVPAELHCFGSEQHSLAVVQGTPSTLQFPCVGSQKPFGQEEPVQHSEEETHAVPLLLHCGGGGGGDLSLHPDTATASAIASPTILGRVRVSMAPIFRHEPCGRKGTACFTVRVSPTSTGIER